MVASLRAPQLLCLRIAGGLDLQSLGSVIWPSKLLEPWVLQRFFCSDTLIRIVYEDPPQKIEEIAAERVARWYDILLKMLVSVLNDGRELHTGNLFIAFTNLLEARVVSCVG